LTHNDHYSGRTAPLTSKRCILYIYSTNIGTEYFKHGIYSPFFFSWKCSLFHNSYIFVSCFIHILYTGVLKLKKKNNSGAKRLNNKHGVTSSSIDHKIVWSLFNTLQKNLGIIRKSLRIELWNFKTGKAAEEQRIVVPVADGRPTSWGHTERYVSTHT